MTSKKNKWLLHKNKAKARRADIHQLIEKFKEHHKRNVNVKKDVKEDQPILADDFISSSYHSPEDEASCSIIRTKAIFTLSSMAVDNNEIISQVLSPVYFNAAEETQVRLAALSLLFVSNPPEAFWQRVALSTWFESNEQVSHYIYTTITSLVASKDPKRRDVIVRAESVLPVMKPMRWMYLSSFNYFKSGRSKF